MAKFFVTKIDGIKFCINGYLYPGQYDTGPFYEYWQFTEDRLTEWKNNNWIMFINEVI